MTVYDSTMTKIRQLPESLVQEVNDFVEFLLMRSDSDLWQQWTQFTESLDVATSDFASYLANLEDYENQLARGEVRW